MSVERRRLLGALGAEVVLTPGGRGMAGAVREARALAARTSDAFVPDQFGNPANPATHETKTAPEIWEGTGGTVDVLVAGIGTGGTITGATRGLRRRNPGLKAIGVEPSDSPVLTEGRSGPHGIQGIGSGFVPDVLDVSLLDEVIPVSTDDAIATARRLALEEGILAGISAGAAMWAALDVASRAAFRGSTVVVVLPDTGERYLSTSLWGDLDV